MEAIYRNSDDDLKNLKATELTLGLPGTGTQTDKNVVVVEDDKPQASSTSPLNNNNKRASEMNKSTPAPKAQVVGWPPVRNFRKNVLTQQAKPESDGSGMFVKVSMDGAPFLRKIDLKCYKNYADLLKGLEGMFKCRFEGCNGTENALTYEDKDGDWMLVGDVPWDMFVTSCKRLRIMKGSEAKGLGAQ